MPPKGNKTFVFVFVLPFIIAFAFGMMLSKYQYHKKVNFKRKLAVSNYTEPVTFTATGRCGCSPVGEDDVYTIKEFKELCESNALIDYDGFGEPVKDNKADNSIAIKPSNLDNIPDDATHIVWYNR